MDNSKPSKLGMLMLGLASLGMGELAGQPVLTSTVIPNGITNSGNILNVPGRTIEIPSSTIQIPATTLSIPSNSAFASDLRNQNFNQSILGVQTPQPVITSPQTISKEIYVFTNNQLIPGTSQNGLIFVNGQPCDGTVLINGYVRKVVGGQIQQNTIQQGEPTYTLAQFKALLSLFQQEQTLFSCEDSLRDYQEKVFQLQNQNNFGNNQNNQNNQNYGNTQSLKSELQKLESELEQIEKEFEEKIEQEEEKLDETEKLISSKQKEIDAKVKEISSLKSQIASEKQATQSAKDYSKYLDSYYRGLIAQYQSSKSSKSSYGYGKY